MEIGTAGLSDFWGSDPVMATVMMHGVVMGLPLTFRFRICRTVSGAKAALTHWSCGSQVSEDRAAHWC
jgi:hypothetical protein